jgi:hypothetical protein
MALLPREEREAWLASQPDWVVEEIARDEWWWTARPEQIPPAGDWSVALALAGRGWGKHIDVDELIPASVDGDTWGFVRMGDLGIGHQVLDETGAPCTITATFDNPDATAYRLQFADGTTIVACDEHQWVTWTHRDRKEYLRNPTNDPTQFPDNWPTWSAPVRRGTPVGPQVRTTHDILDTLHQNTARGDLNHCIPVTAPLQLPDRELPIDPWLLGYWLGNGHHASGAICGHHDDETFVSDHLNRHALVAERERRRERVGWVGSAGDGDAI